MKIDRESRGGDDMSQYDIKYTEIMTHIEQVKKCVGQLEAYKEKVRGIRNVLKGCGEGISSFSVKLDEILSQMETQNKHLKHMEEALHTSTIKIYGFRRSGNETRTATATTGVVR